MRVRDKAGRLVLLWNAPLIAAWSILVVIGVSGFLGSTEWHQEQIRDWTSTLPLRLVGIILLASIGVGLSYVYNWVLRWIGFIDSDDVKPTLRVSAIAYLMAGCVFLLWHFLFGP